MSSCPSAERLARLAQDPETDASVVAIEDHVEQCVACQDSLEKLARLGGESGRPGLAHLPAPGHWPEIPGFVIEHELGRGGMGVVYQARQTELVGRVAIKVVPSGPAAGARERDGWLREARLLSLVPWHPKIVRLLHPGQHDGWLHLVFDPTRRVLNDGFRLKYCIISKVEETTGGSPHDRRASGGVESAHGAASP